MVPEWVPTLVHQSGVVRGGSIATRPPRDGGHLSARETRRRRLDRCGDEGVPTPGPPVQVQPGSGVVLEYDPLTPWVGRGSRPRGRAG